MVISCFHCFKGSFWNSLQNLGEQNVTEMVRAGFHRMIQSKSLTDICYELSKPSAREMFSHFFRIFQEEYSDQNLNTECPRVAKYSEYPNSGRSMSSLTALLHLSAKKQLPCPVESSDLLTGLVQVSTWFSLALDRNHNRNFKKCIVLQGARSCRYEFLLIRYQECNELEGICSLQLHISTVTSRTKGTWQPAVQMRKIAF